MKRRPGVSLPTPLATLLRKPHRYWYLFYPDASGIATPCRPGACRMFVCCRSLRFFGRENSSVVGSKSREGDGNDCAKSSEELGGVVLRSIPSLSRCEIQDGREMSKSKSEYCNINFTSLARVVRMIPMTACIMAPWLYTENLCSSSVPVESARVSS